jgi:hypothetical protein
VLAARYTLRPLALLSVRHEETDAWILELADLKWRRNK